MKDTNKTFPLIAIAQALGRYHLTLFIVVLVSGLSTAVLMLGDILKQSSETTGQTSSLDITSFDQATIDRLSRLKPSSEGLTNYSLPGGRVNPFAE